MYLRSTKRKAVNKENFSESNKTFIQNVDQWVGEAVEKQNAALPVFNTLNKSLETSKICGVSRPSVYNIRNADIPSTSSGRSKIVLDDFAKSFLSRLVLGYYKRSPPVIPTLNLILSNLEEVESFPKLGRTMLHSTLKKLGFTFKKRKKKMDIYQRFDIVVNRHKFLMRIEEYRKKGYIILLG